MNSQQLYSYAVSESSLAGMATAKKGKRFATQGGLSRVQAYLYEDEIAALEETAKRERCSMSEILRRALRAYLKTRD